MILPKAPDTRSAASTATYPPRLVTNRPTKLRDAADKGVAAGRPASCPAQISGNDSYTSAFTLPLFWIAVTQRRKGRRMKHTGAARFVRTRLRRGRVIVHAPRGKQAIHCQPVLPAPTESSVLQRKEAAIIAVTAEHGPASKDSDSSLRSTLTFDDPQRRGTIGVAFVSDP